MTDFPIDRRDLLRAGGVGVVGVSNLGQTAGHSDRSAWQSSQDILFEQDFEKESLGTVPSEFALAGNQNQEVVDEVSATGTQSYRMSGSHGGCWRAIMRTDLLDGDARPEAMRLHGYFLRSDGTVGCHDDRSGRIGWRTVDSSSWSAGSGTGLLQFRPDGEVTAAGETVGQYDGGEWVEFDIEYYWDKEVDQVTQVCRIDGSEAVTVTRAAKEYESELSSLALRSDDFTVYWDDLSVAQIDPSDPATGTVEGSVTDEGGDTISETDVYLATTDQEYVAFDIVEAVQAGEDPDPTAELTVEAQTTTSDDGTYEVDTITPGRYFALVIPPSGTDLSPRIADDITVSDGETHVEDITLVDGDIAADLDPVVNDIFAELYAEDAEKRSDTIVGRANDAAADAFLDGAGIVGEAALNEMVEVTDDVFDVDVSTPVEEFQAIVQDVLSTLDSLETASNGLETMLERLWEDLDAESQDDFADVRAILDESWLIGFEFDERDILVAQGYERTPFYDAAVDEIKQAQTDYEVVTATPPAEGFSERAVRRTLEDVRRQLRYPLIGDPGTVVLPDGQLLKYDQAETSRDVQDVLADLLDGIDSGQRLAMVTKAAGGALILTGKGAPVGAKLVSVGAKSYKSLEAARGVGTTGFALAWVLAQIAWARDVREIGTIANQTIDWIETAWEEGYGNPDVEITGVNLNLNDPPEEGETPYLVANDPTGPFSWIQPYRATEEATVEVTNESDEPAEIRLSMRSQTGGFLSDEATGAPGLEEDEDSITIPANDSEIVDLDYIVDRHLLFGEFMPTTLTLTLWVDGVIEQTLSQSLYVLFPGEEPGSETSSTESQLPAITTADSPPGVTPSSDALSDLRAATETVIEERITPEDTTVSTTYTTGSSASRVEFLLTGAGDLAFEVRDESGNETGFDAAGDEAVTQIPESTYEGPDAVPQRVTVPVDGETTFTLKAVGYRFLTEREIDVSIAVIEVPEREAVLAVERENQQVLITPGETATVDLSLAEIGEQVAVESVDLESETFTDETGTELRDVEITPRESNFDVAAGDQRRLTVEFDAANLDVDESSRFNGTLTVTTANAGELDVELSALVLESEIADAQLVDAEASVESVSVMSAENEPVESPEEIDVFEVYDVVVTGDGSVEVELPRPTTESGVFGYDPGSDWERLETGRTEEVVRMRFDNDVSQVVLGREIIGPDALPGHGQPRDLDGDGLFEDVRGDGEPAPEIADVQALFENMDAISASDARYFNFSQLNEDEVTIFDVQALFNRL